MLAQRRTCSLKHPDRPSIFGKGCCSAALTAFKAYQEVVWLDVTMQGVGAVHALDGCKDLPQDALGGVQAEDQPLPVAALETACCLPASTSRATDK